MVQGSCRMYLERYNMDNENKRNWTTGEATQLMRIADALEEVLRLVKEDQERTRKYIKKQKDE